MTQEGGSLEGGDNRNGAICYYGLFTGCNKRMTTSPSLTCDTALKKGSSTNNKRYIKKKNIKKNKKTKQAITKLRRNGTVDAREGAAMVPSPWFEPLLVRHRLSLTARGGSKLRAWNKGGFIWAVTSTFIPVRSAGQNRQIMLKYVRMYDCRL